MVFPVRDPFPARNSASSCKVRLSLACVEKNRPIGVVGLVRPLRRDVRNACLQYTNFGGSRELGLDQNRENMILLCPRNASSLRRRRGIDGVECLEIRNDLVTVDAACVVDVVNEGLEAPLFVSDIEVESELARLADVDDPDSKVDRTTRGSPRRRGCRGRCRVRAGTGRRRSSIRW